MEDLLTQLLAELDQVELLRDLEAVKIKFLGKKGLINSLFSQMKELPPEQKVAFGARLNKLKEDAGTIIADKEKILQAAEISRQELAETLDLSAPSTPFPLGNRHPVSLMIKEVTSLLISCGYAVAEGPEIEEDHYNFELMNLPKGHPARDMQDTFYIDVKRLLRTHTSPVQARTMQQEQGKAIKIICPGKAYRRDEDDATHSHQFSQIEGLVVDKNVTMADLKGTLDFLMKSIFGAKRQIRFRSSYFPFTEPSVEVDISCICDGKGCALCKGSGYIEVLGAGMVHPNVLRMSGYDPDIYQGFAFGMGVERLAMLKYAIKDIRDFFNNDIRFLNQFWREK